MSDREFWSMVCRGLAMVIAAIKTKHLSEPEPPKEEPIKRIARPD